MTKLKLPLGKDDFKSLRETYRYYVDKSLLIEDLTEDPNDVIVLPRRFGKTEHPLGIAFCGKEVAVRHAIVK